MARTAKSGKSCRALLRLEARRRVVVTALVRNSTKNERRQIPPGSRGSRSSQDRGCSRKRPAGAPPLFGARPGQTLLRCKTTATRPRLEPADSPAAGSRSAWHAPPPPARLLLPRSAEKMEDNAPRKRKNSEEGGGGGRFRARRARSPRAGRKRVAPSREDASLGRCPH